jgi:hypothetical protein
MNHALAELVRLIAQTAVAQHLAASHYPANGKHNDVAGTENRPPKAQKDDSSPRP